MWGEPVRQAPSLSSGVALTSVPSGSSVPSSVHRVRSTAPPVTCGATSGGEMYALASSRMQAGEAPVCAARKAVAYWSK
jgi:hypothetical protein